MNIVEVRNLCVMYGQLTAVSDLSFSIPRGEVFGFIGPNGAGKTSTIRVMATLLKPHKGTVRIKGTDIAKNPQAIRRMIGYSPDSFGVYEDLTVSEYLHFFAAAYRIGGEKRKAVVNDVLALTDLGGKKDSPVDALSRGMKQRLGLARVLLHDPEVLLLDEPASGLDPRARIEIREILTELKEMGKTIFISSHILHELSQLCTRIGILEAGKMVVEGSLEEIYSRTGRASAVEVKISNLDEEMFQKIEAVGGVGSVKRENEHIAIHISPDELTVEDLADRLHQMGARIYMFQPEEIDLEKAFMRLTQGKVQ